MAALNLAGKTSGYIKLKSPDVALNATVELPNKDGILATLDDIGTGGGGSVETVNAPIFKAVPTADQPIPKEVWTKLEFGNQVSGTSDNYDTTNHRFQPKVAGHYYIKANAGEGVTAENQVFHIAVYLNGAIYASSQETKANSYYHSYSVDCLVELNGTTDYVEIFFYTTNPSYTRVSNSATNWFEGVLVKPANSGTLVGGEPVTLDALGIPNHDQVTVKENGNVGIGTNNPTEGQLVVRNDNGDAKINIKVNSSNGANGIPALDFSVGGQGPNDPQARIHAVGRDNYSADIVFSTQMNGTVNPLEERMRIGYDGHTTMRSLGATGEGYVGNFNLTTSNDGAFSTLLLQRDSSIGGLIEFKSKGNNVGSIYTNGTTCILDGFTTRASDVYFSDDEDNPRQGKSLKETLADRDKLIDKLVAKVEALEAKLKKVK